MENSKTDELNSVLEELCDCYSIEPLYEDVWGKQQTVETPVLLDLLRAMDVACDTPEELRHSLEHAQEKRDELLVPPVLVRIEGEALWIPVRIRPTDSGDSLEWQLTEEQGDTHTGSVTLESPASTPSGNGPYNMDLAVRLAPGYHSLKVCVGERRAQMTLIITPPMCYVPSQLFSHEQESPNPEPNQEPNPEPNQERQHGDRWWGMSAQVYGLRSDTDLGVGDFSALSELIELCGERGAAFLNLSPLHAMFPGRPRHISPYSPSSRLFLNTLLIDVRGCPEVKNSVSASALLGSAPMCQKLAAMQDMDLIDYEGASAVKLDVLQLAFQDFCTEPTSFRYSQFQTFCTVQGTTLLRHAIYEALDEYFNDHHPEMRGWPDWPEEFQIAQSAAVVQFAREHADRVDFYRWLQWLADQQLARVARTAGNCGLPIGLCQDLAIGVDGSGAETWSYPDLYVLKAAVGAPPDLVNVHGQNWGLPPQSPTHMVASGYHLFIETLRRIMRYSGAIRIDHVMGLRRLYWIPAGREANAGAYVHYPFQDLLGIVALESQRNRCMVIGEDLGTVTPEIIQSLRARGVLSYRLLYFEQNGDEFKPANEYPVQALAAISTHDLPTFKGWWEGRDLDWRHILNLYRDPADLQATRDQRGRDRHALLQRLALSHSSDTSALLSELATENPPPVLAVHRFLAQTPTMLQLVQLEDLLGLTEQSNVPGTTDEHPNWRRRLPLRVSDLGNHPLFNEIVNVIAAERGGAATAAGDAAAATRPDATYRLQLHSDFTFDHARAILPYLKALGISHVYTSPYLESRAGSRHGYDIINHQRIDSEIGSASVFAAWIQALREQRLGHILDIVPNHMAVGPDNRWWMDVLEHGQASRYAHYFDIDWRPPERDLRGKLLLPVLGEFYGEALESNDLRLTFDSSDGRFVVVYYDQRLRIDPREYDFILNYPVADQPAESVEWGAELADIGRAFRQLPVRTRTHWRSVERRYRDSELLRFRLLSLYQQSAELAALLEWKVEAINRGAGLHHVLERQAWRLAHWRTASDEINYRRFFDNNTLAALRMEADDVFEATHSRILELVSDQVVNGLRIDHPDGLYDPDRYFKRLAQRCAELRAEHLPPLYLVVEKILAADEQLPQNWCVDGTTGYDFSSLVNGLFVNPAAAESLTFTYTQFVGRETIFEDLIYHCKKLVMRRLLAAELRVLTNLLYRLAHANPKTRDFTRGNLQEALKEIVACFPVYRSYINSASVNAQDVARITHAVSESKRRSNVADLSVFDFISSVILQQRRGSGVFRRLTLDFAMKLQQFTSPVTAKAVEDTAFYRYYRLVSLNDVGDEPLRMGVTVEAFHRGNVQRQKHWPHSMLNTSSHDSKRSEDVRARLNVISEVPREWRARVKRWQKMNESHKQTLLSGVAPSRNDEYLLYQTLVGSWPLEELDPAQRDSYRWRIHAYMEKSVREGKLRSSWIAPDDAYEQALRAFTEKILDVEVSGAFIEDLVSFKSRIATAGLLNSLSQVALKLTAPGVPDIYQGMELWGYHLVDPDNRRPVDYAARQGLMNQLGEAGSIVSADALLADLTTGLLKLYVIRQLLHFRQQHRDLFDYGDYIPLHGVGTFANHLCSFARLYQGQGVLVLVPRWTLTLEPDSDPDRGALPVAERWQDTWLELPAVVTETGATMTNLLSGETLPVSAAVPLSQLLGRLPVGVFGLGQRQTPASGEATS